MVIWLSSLPLGLWESCHWGTVPLSVVIAFLLLGAGGEGTGDVCGVGAGGQHGPEEGLGRAQPPT